MSHDFIFNNPFYLKIIHTIIITAVILLLKKIARNKFIIPSDIDIQAKRKWVVTTKNISFFIWFFALIIIWIDQLQAVGATLVLFAAAFVVATKEFILNIIGYIYRTGTKSFSTGDRIEINSIRGDVLDQNITGVTLMEVGSGVKTHQYTGSSVFIPNAVFLSAPVKNETVMGGEYVFHIITVNLKMEDDWIDAEKALIDSAREACAPYLEYAIKQMTYISKKHALDQPGVEPRVNIQIPEHDKITLQLRMPVPSKRRGRIEGEVLRKYLMKKAEYKKKETKVQNEKCTHT
ncbi:MAG: mechanosensitive ion channel family protein [Desulfobacteraceae bacterium]|nr:mechanosensitive ion channel family protein [Desulfobacteraceae bacterium]MCB9494712.1 mechanosensitive ion channel family protein [Desulfobacteraceae bacterium]